MSAQAPRYFRYLFWTCLALVGSALLAFIVGYCYLQADLPSVAVLKDVHYQVPLRVFSSDGKLIAEYGEKRRFPLPFDKIPPLLIDAVLATEDHRFYEHPGVDWKGLARATLQLAITGRKSQGGSTITMQVARNFFLSRRKTYLRKAREILLAIKIDKELPKQKILDLYLNKIYFGSRAYGVAAAAQTYYGTTVDKLTLPQVAMIAGLPKAPSANNPLANPVRAIDRRNHVLWRMLQQHYIDQDQYDLATKAPVSASYHGMPVMLEAPYVAEMVRKAMVAKYGQKAYTNGYQVYTTINSRLQLVANKALQKALMQYDLRHGYRGALQNLGAYDPSEQDAWLKILKQQISVPQLPSAVVISVSDQSATVMRADGSILLLPWQGLVWARPEIAKSYLGKIPETASDVVKVGDVIRIYHMRQGYWRLAQLPQVEGAIVSVNPQDGSIQALVGGFDYGKSKFNRVTQAQRQPGSSFKPFIYSAALNQGFTLASAINDAPIVLNQQSEAGLWRPQNSTKKFYGQTRLRVGLLKSRNLVSIRLLQALDLSKTINYVEQFGFTPDQLPRTLSLALGTGMVTPLQLAAGYSVFANGGYYVKPFLINKILDSHWQPTFVAKPIAVCPYPAEDPKICQQAAAPLKPEAMPYVNAARVLTKQNAYLMTSAMQSVIKQGTGRAARALGRHDLAGKTGTTNDQFDAWFAGFNQNIVTITWMGFDQPRSLEEYAAQSALPMWIDFMRAALKGIPNHSMPEPEGLVSVRIDPKTGLLARPGQKNAMFETFREAHVPKQMAPMVASNRQNNTSDDAASTTPESPAAEHIF